MKFSSFESISILGAVTSAIAQMTGNMTSRCGTSLRADDVFRMEGDFAAKKAANRVAPGFEARAPNPLNINVYFHVLDGYLGPNGEIDGNDTQLALQIQVLNTDYYDAGITFNLAETTHTKNDEWRFIDLTGGDETESDEMKLSLRKADSSASDLNVYIVSDILDELGLVLGYGSFPVDYSNNPTRDGVVIQVSTLPGGAMAGYNLGRVLSHEVGHWCGLYHTFQGGCDEKGPYSGGDYVGDTPPQRYPGSGCPTTSIASCPGGEPAAIQNIMDYVRCPSRFTPEQILRMRAQLGLYRGLS